MFSRTSCGPSGRLRKNSQSSGFWRPASGPRPRSSRHRRPPPSPRSTCHHGQRPRPRRHVRRQRRPWRMPPRAPSSVSPKTMRWSVKNPAPMDLFRQGRHWLHRRYNRHRARFWAVSASSRRSSGHRRQPPPAARCHPTARLTRPPVMRCHRAIHRRVEQPPTRQPMPPGRRCGARRRSIPMAGRAISVPTRRRPLRTIRAPDRASAARRRHAAVRGRPNRKKSSMKSSRRQSLRNGSGPARATTRMPIAKPRAAMRKTSAAPVGPGFCSWPCLSGQRSPEVFSGITKRR